MEHFYSNIQKYKGFSWTISVVYLVFAGCFGFPLRLEELALSVDFTNLVIYGVCYIWIGLILSGLFFGQPGIVMAMTLGLTLLGMGGRYLLEFGEASNIYNFTLINVLVYLLAASLVVTITYWVADHIRKR